MPEATLDVDLVCGDWLGGALISANRKDSYTLYTVGNDGKLRWQVTLSGIRKGYAYNREHVMNVLSQSPDGFAAMPQLAASTKRRARKGLTSRSLRRMRSSRTCADRQRGACARQIPPLSCWRSTAKSSPNIAATIRPAVRSTIHTVAGAKRKNPTISEPNPSVKWP